MKLEEKLQMIADALDVDVSLLNAKTELDSMDEWDSLGKLGLMSMFGGNFGKKLSAARVREFKTIEEILAEMED